MVVFRTYRIGRVLGFPLEVNLSFLIMLGAVVLFMGGLSALAIVSIAFSSVLLHELGHAVVARRLGVNVAGIELHFFGGAAKMTSQPKTARDEVAIAAAGPAVSFVLAGIGLGLGTLSGLHFLMLVGWVNLTIAVFNLAPALPMDGGRILRALLSKRMGFLRSTEVSVSISRVLAVGLAGLAIATSQLFLLLLVFVLWTMGTSELRFARQAPYYPGTQRQHPLVEVLPKGFASWDDHQTRSQAQTQTRRPARPGGVVIHRVNGQVVVEIVTPASER